MIKWFIFFMYYTIYTIIIQYYYLLPMNNDLQKCVILKNI